MNSVSAQERMDFIENLLGDNVQKHSEAHETFCGPTMLDASG